MSRHDDETSRYRTREDRIRERNLRDPYEAQRTVPTDDDGHGHPRRSLEDTREPPWDEQPARYGGGYRGDEASWPRPRGRHGDARDTDAGFSYAGSGRDEDGRRRASGYGRDDDAWRGASGGSRDDHRQSNSGYDSARAYGQGREPDDDVHARHAGGLRQHGPGPRGGAGGHRHPPGRGEADDQDTRTDTYGGAGFSQQGKRYWFDEGDRYGRFRGTPPRGYQRSDERLRELACERLTDADLDASDIEVRVNEASVTLEGSVPARWMKHAAEDLIDDLGGVRDIDNRLRVAHADTGAAPVGPRAAAATPAGEDTPPATGPATPGSGEAGTHSRH